MQPDITMPKEVAIKQYTGLLQQTGTSNPTVQILQNTIGTIIWTRTGIGVYIGTLAGAFPTLKTITNPTGQNNAAFIPIGDNSILEYSYCIYRQNENTIRLETFTNADFSHIELSTALPFNENYILVDIKVYNTQTQNNV